MRRDIKFRGKRLGNGEWVYGNLIIKGTEYYILPFTSDGDSDYHIESYLEDCFIHRVNPKTVGQYIGIEDKNGKEIYEGMDVLCGHLLDWDREKDEDLKIDDRTVHTIKYMGDRDYPAFDLDPLVDCECNGISYYISETEFKLEIIHDSKEVSM